MLRTIWVYTLLILVSVTSSYGQEVNYGRVMDVGLRTSVSGVKIVGDNAQRRVYSNNNGYYKILNCVGCIDDPNRAEIYIAENILTWTFEVGGQINLYSMDGKSLFSSTFEGAGSETLPPLDFGYSVLLISTDDEDYQYLLFSDQSNLTLGKKKNLNDFNFISDDAFTFSKAGYFSRTISTDKEDSLNTAYILRHEYDSIDYFNILLRREAYLMLHTTPPITNFGEIQSIKALYNYNTDVMSYFNVNRFPGHFNFAQYAIDYPYNSITFFLTQYTQHPDKFLNAITINYHQNLDKYVFEFAPYDLVDCQGIEDTYHKLIETSYFGDKLYFLASNQDWEDCPNVPIIGTQELYLGQNYQALNLEENYGYLKKIDYQDLESEFLGRHDIVLTNGIPNDIPVVAGIITTEYQTPLSHINILSHNRNTPNMALIDGYTNPALDTLLNKLIYLKVGANAFEVREATLDEAEAFWDENEPSEVILLDQDVTTSGLQNMSNLDHNDNTLVGGKAANFAEIINLGTIPVPESSFAIPFYYYYEHIVAHGIDIVINNLLDDDQFHTDYNYRKTKLEELKEMITSAPIDPSLESLVLNQINDFADFDAFRFRSSTNAEDLEDFSGAGRYDSFTAKKNHATKTVENAIKKVWASLWNLRAYEERNYFNIDHHSIAMGILVHRSFPDEDANGVILTTNIYNTNHAFTINTQYKDYSIVEPEVGVVHDNLLVYHLSLNNDLDYTIQYLSQSNIPDLNGETVLTDEEIYELTDYCAILKEHYYNNVPNECDCSYEDFALDIEFKIDSQVEDRKIYIKQARLYQN